MTSKKELEQLIESLRDEVRELKSEIVSRLDKLEETKWKISDYVDIRAREMTPEEIEDAWWSLGQDGKNDGKDGFPATPMQK
jgi:ribosomal silencing factor RsfS